MSSAIARLTLVDGGLADRREPQPAREVACIPHVERVSGGVYFYDATGARWRVHDALIGAGHPRSVRLGNVRANARCFSGRDRAVRVYVYAEDDDRSTEARTLARQLERASGVEAAIEIARALR